MWLTPKSDQTSVKDLIFTELYNECRLAAPGAKLSYSCRSKLERLSREERKELVSRLKEGCTPLFVSCKRGNVDIVEFLIEECDADVEQKGVYEVPDDRSIHFVTPIWCASVAGKLNVVKCLVRHGADVNSISDTGSTPVRSACFMTHLEIVKFLVESGADIVKANFNGGTCLINSVQSVPLCQLLLQHGAPVNALDIQHKTALHYAIQEHRFETTRLLLQYGGDPMIKSRYGDDALQTACLKVATQIFDYLIENYPYSKERIADAYELLGSTFLDDHYDIQTALTYWRSALDIRYNLLYQNNPLLSSTSDGVMPSSSSSSSSQSSNVPNSYYNLAAQISSLINASSPLTSPNLPPLPSSSSSATLFNCIEDNNALDKPTGQPSKLLTNSCDFGTNFNNNNNDRQTDGASPLCCDNPCEGDVAALLASAYSSSNASASTCSSSLLRSLIKKNLVPPKYAYGYVVEFTTYEELDALALDLDLMRIQSLLICERILGTAHKDMIFRLMYRGASYADSLQYQRCIEFWIYALDLRYSKDTILHTEASYATQALVRLFLEIHEKSAARLLREELRFEHVFLTVKLIFNQLPSTIRCLQHRPVFKKQQDTFDKLLKTLTHLLYVLNAMKKTEAQEEEVRRLINKILKCDPRTSTGDSLLHLVVSKSTTMRTNNILDEPHTQIFPDARVVELLIESGAVIDAVNNGDSTPLHLACTRTNYNQRVVEILLRKGAHIDRKSATGNQPQSLLSSIPESTINPMKFISLKCLAARKVSEHKILFASGSIPVALEEFIKIH